MREYELTIIIQPEISEEGSQAILAKLDQAMEKAGAIRLLLDDLGKRKLAYEINRFHKGHYYMLCFLDQGGVVDELERVLRLEESVLRFLTVKVEEEVADIEARKAWGAEREIELKKRAAERAAREAEEAKARAEAEAKAAAEAAAAAAAEAEAGEGEADEGEGEGEAPAADEDSSAEGGDAAADDEETQS